MAQRRLRHRGAPPRAGSSGPWGVRSPVCPRARQCRSVRRSGDHGTRDRQQTDCAAALARALAQLDLTLADPRWAGHRRRELARAREVLCDLLAGDKVHGSTTALTEAWFMAYAAQTRAGR